jgi:hypothetical protein
MSPVRKVTFFLLSLAVRLFSVSERSDEVKPQQAKGLGRRVIAFATVLVCVSLKCWSQEPPGPKVTLAIAVSLPDGSVFHIPAVGDGEMTGIVPLSNGRFAGIRITPRMLTDSVRIEASALLRGKKKLSEATCDEIRSWTSEDAGFYDAKENASLLLSGLGRLGLPAFKVNVVRTGGPPPGGFRHPYANSLAFCDCEYPEPRSITNLDGSSASGVAGIIIYPEAGRCVPLSACGQCCRTAIAAPLQQASMVPDQVNTAGWDKAWTNLVNDAEQTFTPSVPRLMGVEVELVVGNPPTTETNIDGLTLRVLNASGRTLAAVTQRVSTANCDQVVFVIPNGGLEVTPGQTYRLKLSGGTTFGWKYVVGGYEKGMATFNGKLLLRDVRSTFLFRTFGPK